MFNVILFNVLPYGAAIIFIAGVLYRFWVWGRTPVPLRIVVPPAPATRAGVVQRLVGDALWFPSLYRADKILWAAGVSFHILLWLVLLRHLRYFLYPVPNLVEALQTPGLYAGYLIPLPLAVLLARRLLAERILYLSGLADFFTLLLLISIAVTGILLKVYFQTYVVDLKAMVQGLVHFQPMATQTHWLFGLHFFLIMVLAAYFPFSKLMHGGGLFLSPPRNQRTNFKERFVNPWDFPVAYNSLNLSTPEKYQQVLAASPEERK